MDKYFKILLYITCFTFACSAPLAQEALSGQTCIDLVSDLSGNSLRAKLFDENGNPKEEFVGMEGYAALLRRIMNPEWILLLEIPLQL